MWCNTSFIIMKINSNNNYGLKQHIQSYYKSYIMIVYIIMKRKHDSQLLLIAILLMQRIIIYEL